MLSPVYDLVASKAEDKNSLFEIYAKTCTWI